MWLHFLIFSFIVVVSYTIPPRPLTKNKGFWFCIFSVLFIIASFRSYNIGNDTREYLRNFLIICKFDSIGAIFDVLRYEPGYVSLCYIVSRFTNNYTIMLCVVNGIYLISVIRFINKYSKDIRLSLLMFFSFSMFYNMMVIQRQCLAIAIFLFAFDYLVDRKPIKYFLLIGLATSFHIMAFVLVALYFAPRANFSKAKDVVIWVTVVTIVMIGFVLFFEVFLRFFPYYSHYFESIYSSGGVRSASVAQLIVRLLCVAILILVGGFKNFYYKDEKINNVLLQMVMIDLLCSLAAIGFNLYDRVETFFTIGLIMACTNVVAGLQNIGNKRICKCVLVFVPFVFLTAMLIGRQNWYGIFPYTFISGD